MEYQRSKCIASIEQYPYSLPPNPWVPAPCSDISRCRNSAPKSPNSENSPSFYSSTPITTFHYSQNFLVESRPILRAEHACQPHFSIAPLVVALLAKSAPIFEDSEFFCFPHHHHFLLQSELRGTRNIDQFCALNTLVISFRP